MTWILVWLKISPKEYGLQQGLFYLLILIVKRFKASKCKKNIFFGFVDLLLNTDRICLVYTPNLFLSLI